MLHDKGIMPSKSGFSKFKNSVSPIELFRKQGISMIISLLTVNLLLEEEPS